MQASPRILARLGLLFLIMAVGSPLLAEGGHEIGVIGGITSYRKVEVSNPERSGDVGPTFGPAAGFVLGQAIGDHWGGEFRYIYFRNDLELNAGASSANFDAESHAVHYDVLYYFNGQDARVRPFAAIGVGLKLYRGTGAEGAFQPGSDLALLTKTSQTVIAGDAGAGVKVRVGSSGMFRVEFRGYVTPVPDKVIADSIDSKISGVLWHWAPLLGFSWTFFELSEGHIATEYLPPYAPELNPVEYIWAYWKQHELPNVCPKDYGELNERARKALRRMYRKPRLITAFWKQSSLCFD